MQQELYQLFGPSQTPKLDIDRLPEFMQRYLREASSCTDARPGLLLTAWLPVCAVNAGNRVHMYNNTGRIYPNVWSCVIGPSGIARKTTAISYARYCIRSHEESLRDATAQERSDRSLVITNSTLSVLLSQLAANPSRLLVQNEFSGWHAEMAKTYNMGYKQHITDLFDNKDRVVATRDRTDAINDPALSVSTASTEVWFMKHMASRADQLGGFLQRMLYYVLTEVDYSELDMEYHDVKAMEERLAAFDRDYFQWWREIPFSQLLELSPQAREQRDEAYKKRHRQCFDSRNDTLMSYFTRIYDGYFYKFCALITLAENTGDIAAGVRTGSCPKIFKSIRVQPQAVSQALYLCDFYLQNTLPLLDLLDENSALATERKLMDIIINRYGGRVSHSKLLNAAHMRKKEFNECLESLIEREAVRVESERTANHRVARIYVANPGLMRKSNPRSGDIQEET